MTQEPENPKQWCDLIRRVMDDGASRLEITHRDHRGEWCVSIDGSAHFHRDLALAVELAATEYLTRRDVVLSPIMLSIEFDECVATLQYRPLTPDTIVQPFPDIRTVIASLNERQEVVTIELLLMAA